jgi:hypothetical protein
MDMVASVATPVANPDLHHEEALMGPLLGPSVIPVIPVRQDSSLSGSLGAGMLHQVETSNRSGQVETSNRSLGMA